MINFNDDEIPQVLRDFLIYTETIKGKSKNTVQEYFYDLRMFFRFIKIHKNIVDKKIEFNTIKISDISVDLLRNITLSDLYSFMSYLNRERSSISTSRARKVASLKSFFNYSCNKAKLIEINPASELESPKILKKLPKYLSLEESRKLLKSIEGTAFADRDFAMITLFLNCGMRLSELCGINLNDIRDETITITGKGGKERTVYLNEASKKAIDKYLEVRPVDKVKDRNALFISKFKKRISDNMVERIIKQYITKAGLDPKRYSVRKLRHTAATLMYRYGNVDIRALQEILGHESIATTEIYTHLDKQQLKNAVDSNPLSKFEK